METKINTKTLAKASIAVILCIICFIGGYWSNEKKCEKEHINYTQMVVDFKPKEEKYDAFGKDFSSAVGLYYLFQKENNKISNYNLYFDTLSYFRDNLVYLNIKDTNYLILYKPQLNSTNFNTSLYGFTKDKFLIYTAQSVLLKNFPKESVSR